ncbi:MAG: lysylphosphatidylglycerol synthase domain-containing protein [Alphaproteobacteria bacterium]
MKKYLLKDTWKYVISAVLIVFILSRVDLHVLLEQSRDVSFVALGLSMIMMVCQILFLSMRWHVLMNAGRVKVSFATATLINVAGSLANILFITSVGGIVAKSGLAIRYGLSVSLFGGDIS